MREASLKFLEILVNTPSPVGHETRGQRVWLDYAKKFAEELWKMDVPSSLVFRYYDGLLYTMCLLHASGRFRVILPPR